jgi:hypothetical protein
VSLDQFLVNASILGLSIIVLGTAVRGHWVHCWTLVPYLVVIGGYDVLVRMSVRYHSWDLYLAKESLVAALRLLLAVELYVRLFAGLPGARRLANWPLLASLGITLLYLWTSTIRADPVKSFQTIIPIATDGATLVLTTILALAAWFRVPADPFHRAILRGLVAYLLVYTLGIHLFTAFGWGSRLAINRVTGLSYIILLVYWGVAAWRPVDAQPAPPGVVRRLRTWASSS